MDGDLSLDFFRRQQEEPASGGAWIPAHSGYHPPRVPLVPAELSFDRADVVQSGLHLDDHERARDRFKGEEIDPAVGPPGDGLHLAGRGPSGSLEAALDIRGATSVNQVTAAALDSERWSRAEIELEPEAISDPPHEIQRRILLPGFDPGVVGTRNTNRCGNLGLGDVQHRSGVTTEASE